MQKRSTGGVIYAAAGKKIKNCLKNAELFAKEFRHYVNQDLNQAKGIWYTIALSYLTSYFFC